MFKITAAVNNIRPVRITESPTAIIHLASRVCHRLIGAGRRCDQNGPNSVEAYPSTASIEVLTITAQRNPQKVISNEM